MADRPFVHLHCHTHYSLLDGASRFDHDDEGAKQFNCLITDGFVDGTDPNHRKHSVKPVHALILPAPPGREEFVSSQQRYCYLSLEHYYSDALLAASGLKDDPVVPGVTVFCIKGDSRKKAAFADGQVAQMPFEFHPLAILVGVEEAGPMEPPPGAAVGETSIGELLPDEVE
jgi:hypothetical protein